MGFDGDVDKTYDYDAYGNEYERDNNDGNYFRYCGEYYDTETGFIYLRARYYDPATGRFVAMDTHWNPSNAIYGDNPVKTSSAEDCKSLYPDNIAIKQSANLYVYCINNPNKFTDKSGYSAAQAALEIWASTGVWLTAVDGILPVGDIIYLIGLGICGIAIAAEAAEAIDKIKEYEPKREHTVYALVDSNNVIQYVGRTKDIVKRRTAHEANPFRKDWRFEVIASELTYIEARTIEQACMAYYHTINTGYKGNNQINGIAPKYWDIYKAAAKNFPDYVWNQVSNELLNWVE